MKRGFHLGGECRAAADMPVFSEDALREIHRDPLEVLERIGVWVELSGRRGRRQPQREFASDGQGTCHNRPRPSEASYSASQTRSCNASLFVPILSAPQGVAIPC